MKLEYTVAQFRKDTRMILNAVDQGGEVYIKRYDQAYRLSPATFSPAPNEVHEGTAIGEPPRKVAPEKKSRLAQPKNKEIAPVDSCPHGYAKSFCKKADCNKKYAKV